MDLIKNANQGNMLTVANLKDRLNEVDDNLLVIFEHVDVLDEPADESHSIDAVQVRGGFFILTSLDT